jgi:hypothetical protein
MSPGYRRQFLEAIDIEREALYFVWQDRQILIQQIMEFKRMSHDEDKGYERYTPKSSLFLNNLEKKLEDNAKELKATQKRIWKIEKSLAEYERETLKF